MDYDDDFSDIETIILFDSFELYGTDTVQDKVDLDYNGGLPPYEENK